jgi:hypothetical protein
MPDANRGPARRTGEADMTHTETNCYGIERATIEISRRRARRLRGRVVSYLLRRVMRRVSALRLQPARSAVRTAVQPA